MIIPKTSTADIEAALQFISPDLSRDDWVCMAISETQNTLILRIQFKPNKAFNKEY